ncbi:MAG: hypothetical protein P8078_07615 [bacterium]
MEGNVWIGTDIGAISIQLVAFIRNAENKRIIDSLHNNKFFQERYLPYKKGLLFFSSYIRHQGNPDSKLIEIFNSLSDSIRPENLASITTTGSGGKSIAEKYNLNYVNEFRASATGIGLLYPDIILYLKLEENDQNTF